MNKFIKLKKNKIKYWWLLKKNKNIKNLPVNPNIGGTPAKDNKAKTIEIITKGNDPTILNSFSVLKNFISNKKNTLNIVNKSKI